jgi:uncharacterized membrane protein
MTQDPATKLNDFVLAPGPGSILFALAVAGLGVLGVTYGDFALQWQPIPESLPWRHGVAYLTAVIMLAGGLGLFFRPIARRCAVVLSIDVLACWVLPQAIKVAGGPILSVGPWLGICETLAVMSGAWILWASRGSLRVARCLFGVSCVVFGLSHFAYAEFTAGMIPGWIPLHLWFAYATGAVHVLAGLGVLLDIRPRLAATVEALMMSSFVILVHIPSLWTAPSPEWAPTVRIQLTALFWASALAGSAWIVAGSLRHHPWGGART